MKLIDIMDGIVAGLSGDSDKDVAYLKDQINKYNGHELHTEIMRECYRLIYRNIPEEEREKFREALQQDLYKSFFSKFEETNHLVQNQDFVGALAIIEPIASSFDRMVAQGLCKDDSESEYRHFDNIFEQIFYKQLYTPTKTVRDLVFPLGRAYAIYGTVLIDLKRALEARTALEKAMHWEPMNAMLALEHAETFKLTGDMDGLFENTKKIVRIAYKGPDLAKCFRNFGYYFVEKKMWTEASVCYHHSLHYEKDGNPAIAELAYIKEQCGHEPELTLEIFENVSRKYGIPAWNVDAAVLAYQLGKTCVDKGMKSQARYFLDLSYSIVQYEEVKELLDSLGDDQAESFDYASMLKLPDGYRLVQNRPTDPDGCVSYALQNSLTLSLLQVYPIEVDDSMPFNNPKAVIDGIHGTLKDNQALIEVNAKIFSDASASIYSIVKNKHEGEASGVQYFMLLHLLVNGKMLAVKAFFDEYGTSGGRDCVVNELLRRDENVTLGDDGMIKGWMRDPYDASITDGFLMNMAEEPRFDKIFPEHPLSVCRDVVARINSVLSGTPDETSRESDSKHEKELPSKPAERPRGKTVIEWGRIDYVEGKDVTPQVHTILYSDGRLFKAYYSFAEESHVNGIWKPVLYELIGTFPEATAELKTALKDRYDEYMKWPDRIDAYGGYDRLRYFCHIKVPSRKFFGHNMFEVEPFGPKVKELCELIEGILQKQFPDFKLE